MQLAKEVLGGKYEFVLTTHIDKNHVHNHLIFNAVSFQDHKHYHSNKRSYHEIRRTGDRICKEHGLSVIVPGQDKDKSYIEHQAVQAGTSYKAKLKAAIDRLIPASSDIEDLLARLQREGYEIKRGKPGCSGKGMKLSGENIVLHKRRIRRGSPGSRLWAPITRRKPSPPGSPEAYSHPDSCNSVTAVSVCSLIFKIISKPSRTPYTSGGRPLRISSGRPPP